MLGWYPRKLLFSEYQINDEDDGDDDNLRKKDFFEIKLKEEGGKK